MSGPNQAMFRLFRVRGGVRPQGAPVVRLRRRVNLGALGGSTERQNQIPMPDGSDGSAVWPYAEQSPWWNVGPGGFPTLPPLIGATPAGVLSPGGQGGYAPTPAPYAPSDPNSPVPWTNPCTASIVPILASTPANVPVLSLNYQRNLLVLQNNSTATSPDTTPIFYINFNAQVASAGLGIALAAGIGIVFDIICPRDSVYVLQVGGGGATLVVAGVAMQGTYAPAAPPAAH